MVHFSELCTRVAAKFRLLLWPILKFKQPVSDIQTHTIPLHDRFHRNSTGKDDLDTYVHGSKSNTLLNTKVLWRPCMLGRCNDSLVLDIFGKVVRKCRRSAWREIKGTTTTSLMYNKSGKSFVPGALGAAAIQKRGNYLCVTRKLTLFELCVYISFTAQKDLKKRVSANRASINVPLLPSFLSNTERWTFCSSFAFAIVDT